MFFICGMVSSLQTESKIATRDIACLSHSRISMKEGLLYRWLCKCQNMLLLSCFMLSCDLECPQGAS